MSVFEVLPEAPRRISAIEAARIALDILYRAEDERARIAEEEATRGIDATNVKNENH